MLLQQLINSNFSVTSCSHTKQFLVESPAMDPILGGVKCRKGGGMHSTGEQGGGIGKHTQKN